MNRAVFYDDIRETVFRGELSESQFKNMEILLNTWEDYYAQDYMRQQLAYLLATAYHETARTMKPIYERGKRSYFNKYDPKYNPRLAKRLGNTKVGDGYLFRGAGHVQNTGRGNARRSSKMINDTFGLSTDFEGHPEQRIESFNSSHCLFLCSLSGLWTGRKLTQYITKGKVDYKNSRRVINGTDRASLIAGYAQAFDEALKKAEEADPVEVAHYEPPITGKPMRDSTTNIAALASTAAGVSAAGAQVVTNVESMGTTVLMVVLVGIILFGGYWIIKERHKKKFDYGV